MKVVFSILFASVAWVAFADEPVKPVAAAQSRRPPNEVMPLIQMDDVPLRDAIKNLARVAGWNCIIDSEVISSFSSPNGEFAREPLITRRWENVTPGHALTNLIAAFKLKLVTNSSIQVARIVFTNKNVKPVAVIDPIGSADPVIPVISMDEVYLADAIKNLARAGSLQVTLDSHLHEVGSGPGRKPMAETIVSIRWENLTARQALSALLDNYDLVLIPGSDSSPGRIVTKAQAEKEAAEKAGK